MKIISFLFLTLILSASAFAQTATSNKVAVVDTSIFSDPTKGIKILVKRENSYNIEYYLEQTLRKRINELEKEVYCLQNQNKSSEKKSEELKKLKAELKRTEENKKAEIERKYSLIVKPVIEKIREKLKEFANLKGYAIVIDKSNTSLLIEGEVDDITSDFIRFCNEIFEKENLQ